MHWKLKLIFFVILSVPAFSGYPLNLLDTEIISGITRGWFLYFLLINTSILVVNGKQFFENTVAIAALISLPVVFLGAAISYLIYWSGLGYADGPPAYSSHYISLCITMLTVIPLSLTMIAVVPFHEFEHNLLKSRSGVSKPQRFFLMFLRVFNHIIYSVIPNIIETLREERCYHQWVGRERMLESDLSLSAKGRSIHPKLMSLIREMIQLAVEGICASIQYVPLWAVEISQLPNRKKDKDKQKS
jgi:hypothetical protein